MANIIDETWELAKGGRSVNAGRFGKIRMESADPEALQLVAAAPRVLRALEAIVRAADSDHANDEGSRYVEVHRDEIEAARAAIAAARGGAR